MDTCVDILRNMSLGVYLRCRVERKLNTATTAAAEADEYNNDDDDNM